MPIIKPISDLRNKAKQISALVHKSRQPVFITKNGEGDMVVMSIAHYEKMQWKYDVMRKLAEAQAERAAGAKTIALEKVMKDVRKKLHDKFSKNGD